MAGYVKKIAVIKQVKGGFSADGGALSGLVKAETYAGFLKVEASLINFAPLSEGRYVLGISDGLNNVLFEGNSYEGETEFNLSCGFAFLVCFCNGSCAPVASAACGQMACALPDLKEEMRKSESAGAAKSQKKETAQSAPRGLPPENRALDNCAPEKQDYDDEAIAEENYFEYNLDEDGGAVRKDKAKKTDGREGGEDAKDFSAVQMPEKRSDAVYAGADAQGGAESGAVNPPLADGDFYGRMRADIEKIFSSHPKIAELEEVMEGSRWAKIQYGEGKFYAFGVLKIDGVPRYICYGVPAAADACPQSMRDCASHVPTRGGGFWVMYQDARTGVSVKIGAT